MNEHISYYLGAHEVKERDEFGQSHVTCLCVANSLCIVAD